MILKFPYSEDLREKLSTYDRKIRSICFPKQTSNERFCYVRLSVNEKDGFLKQIGVEQSNVTELHDDSEEMPDVTTSKKANLYDCESYED